MPQITFTQFCNELARVLGTCQHAATKASVKTITAASTETESEEEGVVTKSQTKKDGKINAQSSQIKDLRSKLDQAVAENSQIREFLSPTSLAEGIHQCPAGCPGNIQIQRKPWPRKTTFSGKTPPISAFSWD